jgi:hypothetical protein
MPRRLSRAKRRKLALLMRRLNQRRNADPAFRAASSERMKRRRRDPAFVAAWSAAVKRLHADPGFKAAKRAQIARLNADSRSRAAKRAHMKRLNADPEFRAASRARLKRQRADPAFAAKRLAACSIPAKTRAAIVAALRADPNASRVAATAGGASHTDVVKIARAAGIRLRKGRPPRRRAAPNRIRPAFPRFCRQTLCRWLGSDAGPRARGAH